MNKYEESYFLEGINKFKDSSEKIKTLNEWLKSGFFIIEDDVTFLDIGIVGFYYTPVTILNVIFSDGHYIVFNDMDRYSTNKRSHFKKKKFKDVKDFLEFVFDMIISYFRRKDLKHFREYQKNNRLYF